MAEVTSQVPISIPFPLISPEVNFQHCPLLSPRPWPSLGKQAQVYVPGSGVGREGRAQVANVAETWVAFTT